MTVAAQWSWAGALVLLCAGGPSAQGARDGMLGTWRGTSLCTNREALPACADEQVIYDITASKDTPGAIVVKADKVVDGRRVPMGEVTFHPDATTARWVSEIRTPNVHALWYLSLHERVVSGGMTLLPSQTPVRVIELRRGQGSE